MICALLYMNTGSLPKTIIVLLAVPFSAVGAVWFMYLAGYNTSVAVWVGLIRLLGIEVETRVFMLLMGNSPSQLIAKVMNYGRLARVPT
jgi:copper/silver efflux system protein